MIAATIIILAMLLNFLIFAIPFWIVLIVDIIVIIVGYFVNITTDITKKANALISILEFIVLIVFMIIIMMFPTNVCGGSMQNLSNAESVQSWFGYSFSKYNIPDETTLIKTYRQYMGIFFACLIAINSLALIIGAACNRNSGCVSVLPLVSIAATLVTCFSFSFFISIGICGFTIVCTTVGSIVATLKGDDDDDAGSTSTYDVFIFKRDE